MTKKSPLGKTLADLEQWEESWTDGTAATESTKPKPTDATTRETHLARLEDLFTYLKMNWRHYGTEHPAVDRHIFAASLRWMIKRERARS